ncbi:MAG: hypothetical protein WDM90_16975 [Ferruginibacter sp.]
MNKLILVDENDVPLGTIDKMEAHQKALLHRAFSVFILMITGKCYYSKEQKINTIAQAYGPTPAAAIHILNKIL